MIQFHTLKNRIVEAGQTVTLQFVPQNKRIEFQPGQFIMVHLKDEDGKISEQGKSYSISSSPIDEDLSITVKQVGLFSGKLHNLSVGDTVGISGPAGWFVPKEDMQHVICLAGGIGISPFRSILRSSSTLFPKSQFTLFYSDRLQGDLVFLRDLEEIKNGNKNISTVISITRETPSVAEYKSGRIDRSMIKSHVGSFLTKHFFICGSLEFVYGMRKLLQDEKVDSEHIHVEIF